MANLVQRVADMAFESFAQPQMKDNLKGLEIFIADIKRCKSKKSEVKRVNRELANIRTKFCSRIFLIILARKNLDSYQKKKYIAKLLFIYLLGYPIEFGHLEALNLITCSNFSGKSIGYMFLSVIFSPQLDAEYVPLLISALKKDISSDRKLEAILALRATAQGNGSISCAFAMIRLKNDLVFDSEDDLYTVCTLIKSERFTTMMSSLHLLEQLMLLKPDRFQSSISTVFDLLELVIAFLIFQVLFNYTHASLNDGVMAADMYYRHYQPWTLIKLLRVLKLYNFEESSINQRLKDICDRIVLLIKGPVLYNRSHYINMKHAIIFEFISTCINTDSCYYLSQILDVAMEPLTSQDSNLKGLTLNCLGMIFNTDFGRHLVLKFQQHPINVLKNDKVLEVRKIAFNVCYSICSQESSEEIVSEMIGFLSCCPTSTQQDPALKITILAEKFAPSLKWYVDKMIILLQTSGQHLSEGIWHRVARLITSNNEIQQYASQSLFDILNITTVDENLIKLGAYILGECGVLISKNDKSTPCFQLQILQNWFPFVSTPTKCIIITTFGKFMNLYSEIQSDIENVFKIIFMISICIDTELQQRVIETLALYRLSRRDLLAIVYEVMPSYEGYYHEELNSSQSSASLSQTESTRAGSYVLNQSKDITPPQDSISLFVDTPSFPAIQVVHVPLPLVNANNFILESIGTLFQTPLIEVNASISLVTATATSPSCSVSLLIKNKTINQITDIICEHLNSTSSSFIKLSFSCCPYILSESSSVVNITASLSSMYDYHIPIEYYIKFKYENGYIQYNSTLPIYPHHFILPVVLSSQVFFSRWHSLGNSSKECLKVFQTTGPIAQAVFISKIKRFRLEILEKIDPNPHNICAAGGIYFSTFAAGILIRLEINQITKSCRLSVRSTNYEVAENISNILIKVLE
ncbi:hypothetical protein HZS_7783 [Henneguya salminicola]|nr:hypothetical protein HZS_7783 [Henneguya salminicola]